MGRILFYYCVPAISLVESGVVAIIDAAFASSSDAHVAWDAALDCYVRWPFIAASRAAMSAAACSSTTLWVAASAAPDSIICFFVVCLSRSGYSDCFVVLSIHISLVSFVADTCSKRSVARWILVLQSKMTRYPC